MPSRGLGTIAKLRSRYGGCVSIYSLITQRSWRPLEMSFQDKGQSSLEEGGFPATYKQRFEEELLRETKHQDSAATVGLKFDTGKAPWELMPFDALEVVAQVLEKGKVKYEARNWERGMAWGRLLGGVFRHLRAYAMREDRDPETGLPHLAHAACGILFLLAYFLRGSGDDDRTTFHIKDGAA